MSYTYMNNSILLCMYAVDLEGLTILTSTTQPLSTTNKTVPGHHSSARHNSAHMHFTNSNKSTTNMYITCAWKYMCIAHQLTYMYIVYIYIIETITVQDASYMYMYM